MKAVQFLIIKCKHPYFPAFCMAVIFFALWRVVYWIWIPLTDQCDKTFLGFNNEWGTTIGITATILVGILAFLIPSRVENQISEILHQPLVNFHAIHRGALKLLKWVGQEPGSTFVITCANPVFGIELDKESRLDWENAISYRHQGQTNDTTTIILCLRPNSPHGPTKSPLWLFCKSLESCRLLLHSETKTAFDLFNASVDKLFKFPSESHERSGLQILTGDKLFLNFVLAKKCTGESKAVIYFNTSNSSSNKQIYGFSTEDYHWIEIIEKLSEAAQKDYHPLQRIEDWGPKQQERCMELLKAQIEHDTPYKAYVEGYDLTIFPEVFPPQLGKCTKILIESIKKIKGAIQSQNISPNYSDKLTFSAAAPLPNEEISQLRKCIGIDVGTGTGILAFELAEFCSSVYATDILPEACNNAIKNIDDLSKLHPNLEKILISEDNVITNLLGELRNGETKNAYVVIVFNFPFYQSPLAVFNPGSAEVTGSEIVKMLLSQAREIDCEECIILLPFSEIAGKANNPVLPALECGYYHVQIAEIGKESVHGLTTKDLGSSVLKGFKPVQGYSGIKKKPKYSSKAR